MIYIKMISSKKTRKSCRNKNKLIRIIREINQINDDYKRITNLKDLTNDIFHSIFCILIKNSKDEELQKELMTNLVNVLDSKLSKLRCKSSGFKINQDLNNCIKDDILKVIRLISLLRNSNLICSAILLTNVG